MINHSILTSIIDRNDRKLIEYIYFNFTNITGRKYRESKSMTSLSCPVATCVASGEFPYKFRESALPTSMVTPLYFDRNVSPIEKMPKFHSFRVKLNTNGAPKLSYSYCKCTMY